MASWYPARAGERAPTDRNASVVHQSLATRSTSWVHHRALKQVPSSSFGWVDLAGDRLYGPKPPWTVNGTEFEMWLGGLGDRGRR